MNTDEHGFLFGMLAVHLNGAELHTLCRTSWEHSSKGKSFTYCSRPSPT